MILTTPLSTTGSSGFGEVNSSGNTTVELAACSLCNGASGINEFAVGTVVGAAVVEVVASRLRGAVVVVAGDEDGIDVVVVVVDDGVVVVVVPLCVGEAAGAAVVVVDTVTVADEVDEPASFPCASCTAEFEVAELDVGAEYVTDTTLPTAAAGDTLSRIVEPLTVTELTVRETPPTVTAYSPTVADVACKASL
jgi:hypothetical protein